MSTFFSSNLPSVISFDRSSFAFHSRRLPFFTSSVKFVLGAGGGRGGQDVSFFCRAWTLEVPGGRVSATLSSGRVPFSSPIQCEVLVPGGRVPQHNCKFFFRFPQSAADQLANNRASPTNCKNISRWLVFREKNRNSSSKVDCVCCDAPRVDHVSPPPPPPPPSVCACVCVSAWAHVCRCVNFNSEQLLRHPKPLREWERDGPYIRQATQEDSSSPPTYIYQFTRERTENPSFLPHLASKLFLRGRAAADSAVGGSHLLSP